MAECFPERDRHRIVCEYSLLNTSTFTPYTQKRLCYTGPPHHLHTLQYTVYYRSRISLISLAILDLWMSLMAFWKPWELRNLAL